MGATSANAIWNRVAGLHFCGSNFSSLLLKVFLLGTAAILFVKPFMTHGQNLAFEGSDYQVSAELFEPGEASTAFEHSYVLVLGPLINSHLSGYVGPNQGAVELVEGYLTPYLDSIDALVVDVSPGNGLALIHYSGSEPQLEDLVAQLESLGLLQYEISATGEPFAYFRNAELELFEPPAFTEPFTPNDPRFLSGQQPFHRPNGMWMTSAWGLMTGVPSHKVIVAIFDTGLRLDHMDLSSRLWKNTNEQTDGQDTTQSGCIDDIHGCWIEAGFSEHSDASGNPILTYRMSGSNLSDSDGHGTLMSGLAAAETDNSIGVAGAAGIANIELLTVKLTTNHPGPSPINFWAIARAIDYLKALRSQNHNIKVANLSLGIDGSSTDGRRVGPMMCKAIASLPQVLFVAAAGNSGSNLNTKSVYPATCGSQNLITVTAHELGHGFEPELVSSANFGDQHVDISTNTNILSTSKNGKNAYSQSKGTSAAAAVTSGVSAMLMSLSPQMTPSQVVQRLRQTAIPVNSKSFRSGVATMGRLNACTAIAGSVDPSYLGPSKCGCCETGSCVDPKQDTEHNADYFYRYPCTCINYELETEQDCQSFLSCGLQLKATDSHKVSNWFHDRAGYFPDSDDKQMYPWDQKKDVTRRSNCPSSKTTWTHDFICEEPAFRHCPCPQGNKGRLWDCSHEYGKVSPAVACKDVCEEEESYHVDSDGNWLCCPPETVFNSETDECEEDEDKSLR